MAAQKVYSNSNKRPRVFSQNGEKNVRKQVEWVSKFIHKVSPDTERLKSLPRIYKIRFE